MSKKIEETFKWLNRNPALSTAERILKEEASSEKVTKVNVLNLTTDDVDIDLTNRYKRKRKTNCNIRQAAISLIFGDCVIVHTARKNSDIPARYALAKIDDVQASHIVADSYGITINPLYPVGCQERNYDQDQQLQVNVMDRTKSFDPMFVVNNSPTAEDGAPIIDQNGYVLGGNSRTMILKNVFAQGGAKLDEYYAELYEQLDNFGLSRDNIKSKNDLKGYILVRVIDATEKECNEYSRLLNTSTKNEFSLYAQALSFSKQLTKSMVVRLSEQLDYSGANTLSELFSVGSSNADTIIQIFRKAGIINQTNVNQFMVLDSEAELSEVGKLLIGYTLIAKLVKNVSDLALMDTIYDKVTLNIGKWLQIKALGGAWDITKRLPKCVLRLRQVKKMSKFNIRNLDFEETRTDDIDDILVEILDKKPSEAREILASYIELANEVLTPGQMFPRNIEPIDALIDSLDHYKEKRQAINELKELKQRTKLSDKPKRKNRLMTRLHKELNDIKKGKIFKTKRK
jgi:hypothetical protein